MVDGGLTPSIRRPMSSRLRCHCLGITRLCCPRPRASRRAGLHEFFRKAGRALRSMRTAISFSPLRRASRSLLISSKAKSTAASTQSSRSCVEESALRVAGQDHNSALIAEEAWAAL